MSNNTHKPSTCTSPSPSNKCSCSNDKKQSTDCCLSPKNKNSGTSSVVEDSPEASPSKDRNFKKSLSSFVNLRRGKSFNFKAKRGSKKITTTATSTSSSTTTNTTTSNSSGSNLGSSLSKKWPLKFNCARNKDNKSTSVITTETSSCCECVCYRRNATEDATSVPLTADSANTSLEGATVTTAPSSLVTSAETIESEVVATASSQHQQPEDVVGSGESELAAVVGNASVGSVVTAAAAATAVVTSAGTVASRVTIHVMTDEERQAVGIYGNSGGNDGWEPVFHISNNLNNIHEDCDEAARLQRAREIEQGVAPPANYRRVQVLCCSQGNSTGDGSGSNANGDGSDNSNAPPRRLQIVCPSDVPVDSLRALFQANVTLRSCPLDTIAGCHTQVDFVHCLVPDLFSITNCTFYWGKMDRYEAERLLDSKPEGTFLLRDSAQEEFLFSVSFRKYGRSLHARIEQWNHKFSFDAHDPGVYTSSTVCGLIEHYKDPSSCMFFEPMLTRPLHRNFTFPLQHLARAAITTRMVYDNVNQLQLPKTLKSYLKEYHYRQKVRMESFDDDLQWLDLRSNQGNN